MASPLNQRLLAAAPAARRHLVFTGLVQGCDTLLTLSRALLIGMCAAQLIEDDHLRWDLFGALIIVVSVQAVVAYVARLLASRSIGATVDQLRSEALAALARRDPREVEAEAAHWRTTLTSGLDGVRPYLSDYVPALVAAALSTPIALTVMFYFDTPSAILAAVTLPLIPLFMVLIGTLTRSHTQQRLTVAGLLSGQMADLLQGAPTLRALGATKAPHEQLLRTGKAHVDSTMSVLRLAFLSSFALEFLATLSVALIAVNIGLRLVDGRMTLVAGLVALIIAPEVYAPLRRVGASFHAAVDGMTAAEEIFDLIDSPATSVGTYRSEISAGVCAESLTIHGRDGARPDDLSFKAHPGQITILHGSNGSGKSSVLLALVGQLPDQAVSGRVYAPPLAQIGFLPAHPAFCGGTIQDNLVLLGAVPAHILPAARSVGFDLAPEQLVHQGGSGISAGQGQRLALARLFAVPTHTTLLLDEPSAHLSPELVSQLCTTLRNTADQRRTVVVCSHDDRLRSIADQVIEL